ncbi:MAG: Rieske 2Fe-2S domain-containing protein [Deltaproteobacteria bacterium]|nr:Rieske 2Fe-2S domain-containing protein [Deltaproteobacteria bacterium]
MFWQPIYRAQDLRAGRAVPIRIMSESYTLYRGESGSPHLLDFRCAHRGTQLSTGWVEGDSIRCRYHGWRYGADGLCVEQPGEAPDSAGRVQIKSYPTREYLGLVFAYLGEGEPPPFRRFPDLDRPGLTGAGEIEYWPCNYFNRLDNACDAGHVVFTHRESIERSGRLDQLAVRQVSAEETEYGVRTSIHVPGKSPVYLHCHMPNINQVRVQVMIEGSAEDVKTLWADRLFWRVPVDDERCVSFAADWIPLTGEAARKYEERRQQSQAAFERVGRTHGELGEAILQGQMEIKEIDPVTNMYQLFLAEDYSVQVGQGAVADRSHESLGKSDVGVFLLRKIWERELTALAEGRPLKNWATPAGLADQSVID